MKTKRLIFVALATTFLFTFCDMKAQTSWTFSSPYIYSTVSSDKVGVGTTTPAYPIQLGTAVSAGSLSSGGNFSVGFASTAGAVGEQSTNKHAVFGSLGTNKDMLFSTYNGTTFDEWMRITYLGKMGIGTSAPAEKVEANGSIYANAEGTFVGADAAGNSRIGFVKKAGTYPVIATGSATPMIFGIWNTTNLGGGNISSGGFSEKMRLLTTGNFGIGTTTPASKLDVEGSVAIGNTYSGTTAAPTNGAIIEGNVGIGTTSPAQKLDVAGTVQMTGFKFTTGANNGYILTSDANGVGAWTVPNIGTITGSCSSGTNYVPKMSSSTAITCSQIYDDGTNVGIGTTTPDTKLEVNSSVVNDSRTITMTNNGSSRKGHVGFSGSSTLLTSNYYTTGGTSYLDDATYGGCVIQLSSQTTSGSFMTFNLSNAGTAAPTEYMRITNGGNVGIGTNAPFSKLSVRGNLAVGDGYTGTAGPTDGAIIKGNVGIGTTAPTVLLQVGTSGDGTVAKANAWNTFSDANFKTNVVTIQNALKKIVSLRGVTYDWIASGEPSIGFIAQEVDTVLHCIVLTDTITGYKSLDYSKIVPVIVEGIKQLDSINTDLALKDSVNEAKIQALEVTDSILKVKLHDQDSIITLLQNQLIANNTLLQDQLNELTTTINGCCNRSMELSANNNQAKSQIIAEDEAIQTNVELNNAQTIILEQNSPNPYAERTSINYYLPDDTGKAQILFYNSQGKLIQSVELIQKGKGTLNVFASDLSNGIYIYTLVVDGKVVDSKKMVKNK